MRIALLNPNWSFEGSLYFGCREPHLALELGGARALLHRAGHDVVLIDAHLHGLRDETVRALVLAFRPDFTVVTTAPTSLFWRCPPPELRVPRRLLAALGGAAGTRVVVGPHPSITPGAALVKLGADVAVLGECEEVLVKLAEAERARWYELPSVAWLDSDGAVHIQGKPHVTRLEALPPLRWSAADVERHHHHHQRFDEPPRGPGAELESVRDAQRKRPLAVVLDELDALLAQGVQYVYFTDEIFAPDSALLEALAERTVSFGAQLRIDQWTEELLDLLGRAGCRSLAAGVHRLGDKGLAPEVLTERLAYARRRVPFVQANLLDARLDDPAAVDAFCAQLHALGVWAETPLPPFPYPGTAAYRLRWGLPDDRAWERAHAHYLSRYARRPDIRNIRPQPLEVLEGEGMSHG